MLHHPAMEHKERCHDGLQKRESNHDGLVQALVLHAESGQGNKARKHLQHVPLVCEQWISDRDR